MAIVIPDLKSKLYRIAEAHGTRGGYPGIAGLMGVKNDAPRYWVRDQGRGPNYVPDGRVERLIELIKQKALRDITTAEAITLLMGPYVALHSVFENASDTTWSDWVTNASQFGELLLEYGPETTLGVTELAFRLPTSPDAQDVELDTKFYFRFAPPSKIGEVALLKSYEREWRSITLTPDSCVTLACSGEVWMIPGEYEEEQMYFHERDDEGQALFLAIGVRGVFPHEARHLLQHHQPLLPHDRDRLAEILSKMPDSAVRIAARDVFFIAGDI